MGITGLREGTEDVPVKAKKHPGGVDDQILFFKIAAMRRSAFASVEIAPASANPSVRKLGLERQQVRR